MLFPRGSSALVALVLVAAVATGGISPLALAETPAPSDKVAATVNGEAITEADIAFIGEDFAAELQRVPEEERRRILLELLIDMKIMARAAEKDGLADSETFRSRMALYRVQALRDAFYVEKIDKSISEADVKARYEKSIADFEPLEEVHARHILVASEDEAKAIIKELEDGADFAELAKEKSTGPSAPSGGDLGFFTKGRMVPAFEEAAFALEPGTFTKEPVKSEFGWHVIKVEERRRQEPPAYDKVHDRIEETLKRERLADTLQGLKKEAEIDILESSAPTKVE